MTERVLIVDDESNMRWVLKEALTTAGYEAFATGSGQEALSLLAQQVIDLVVLDLRLKGMDGLSTLRRIRERWPEVVVIILTAYGTVATAVEAMQLGAADYLRKPFDVEEVSFKIQRALERKALQSEVRRLRQVAYLPAGNTIVGVHPRWQRCLDQVRSLTDIELDLLLLGEPGAGKTLLARLSHTLSTRSDAPLIELDLSAMTGPMQQHVLFEPDGAWSRAGSGTILLRHGELLQSEVWATLEDLMGRREGRGPRLLVTSEVPLDRAVIPLAEIHVPALRDHIQDLALLAQHFIPGIEILPSALGVLERYLWPGNIAELRSVLERARALAGGGKIEEQHLAEHVLQLLPSGTSIRLPPEGLILEDVEISLIRQALEHAAGNKTRAAELLGLTRHTLLYRLEKYGLEKS